MHAMTASHLRNAHGGESMAHMRYQIWGGIAKQEGYPNVSRLFTAISSAETIHAINHFHELRKRRRRFTVCFDGSLWCRQHIAESSGGYKWRDLRDK